MFSQERKDTFFKRGAEGGPRLPGPPPFSMPDLDFRHGNLPKKQRILTRLPGSYKNLARTRSCVRQSRTLGVSTGWHCQASFQKFLRNFQNWRGHSPTLVRPRIPGVLLRVVPLGFSFAGTLYYSTTVEAVPLMFFSSNSDGRQTVS